MRDTFTTTVEAAAAWAREDPYDDRPTLAELAGEDAPRCSVCGLRPTWDDEGDPCDACREEEPFWESVRRCSENECWVWTGTISPEGYGTINKQYAHRLAYTFVVGPIPDGLHLDHTCHNPDLCAGGSTCPHRRCVNPSHLEAVTPQENIRRGLRATCSNGHPRTEENIYVRPDTGARQCRLCMKASDQRRVPRQRAQKRESF